jgi:hypothetical protein
MPIHTFGPNAVDWEERVDLARLRGERLARLRAQLEASELGALLSFDFANIRYMTSTHIGTWAVDKLIRFALLPRGGEPVVWDFGSADALPGDEFADLALPFHCVAASIERAAAGGVRRRRSRTCCRPGRR